MLCRAAMLVVVAAVLGVGCAPVSPDELPPTFQDYPSHIVHAGPGVPIDWSSDSTARRFRTQHNRLSEEGANFAGHLSIVTWGCGTQCRDYLFLDLRSGRIISDTLLDFSCRAPEFRRESELIVQRADTTALGPCSRGHTRYFRWTGEQLEEIRAGTT